jgi:hypothetical protein
MSILRFEREKLTKELASLPKRLRAAFAAACAQRFLPTHIHRAEATRTSDPTTPCRIMRTLWDCLEADSYDVSQLRSDHDACMSLIPHPDAQFVEGEEYLQEALASLIYALSVQLTGDSQDAAWAAESTYNALDGHVVEQYNIDWNRTRDQSLIDSFPPIQAELRRQQVDLAELRSAAKNRSSETAVIARIRRRAEADSATFLGPAGRP